MINLFEVSISNEKNIRVLQIVSKCYVNITSTIIRNINIKVSVIHFVVHLLRSKNARTIFLYILKSFLLIENYRIIENLEFLMIEKRSW